MNTGTPSQVNSTLILFVSNSKITVHRFLLLFKLKRIWVEGGDPSGAGNFSLEVNKSKNCAHTWPNYTKLDSPICLFKDEYTFFNLG